MKTTSKIIAAACTLLGAGALFAYKYFNNRYYTEEEMRKKQLEEESKILDNPEVPIKEKKRSMLDLLKDRIISSTTSFDPNQDITEFDGDQKIEVSFDEGNYVIKVFANYESKKERSNLKRAINDIKSDFERTHELTPYMKAMVYDYNTNQIKKYEEYDHESDNDAYILLSLRSAKASTNDVCDLLYRLVYDESMTEYMNYPIYFDMKDSE